MAIDKTWGSGVVQRGTGDVEQAFADYGLPTPASIDDAINQAGTKGEAALNAIENLTVQATSVDSAASASASTTGVAPNLTVSLSIPRGRPGLDGGHAMDASANRRGLTPLLRAMEAGEARIVVMGDSNSEGFLLSGWDQRWMNVLRDKLRARWNITGDQGEGYLPATYNTLGSTPPKPARGGTSGNTVPFTSLGGLGLRSLWMKGDGTVTWPALTFSATTPLRVLINRRVGHGSIEILVDGAVAATVATGGTDAIIVQDITVTAGTHTVSARGQGGSTVQIAGIEHRTGQGVAVYDGALSGATAATYTDPSPGQALHWSEVQRINPHLLIVALGANDMAPGQSYSRTPQEWEDDLAQIVALRDQHAPNAGLLLLHGAAPANDPAGLDRLREYEARARAALEDAPRASILYLSSLWQPRLDHTYTLMTSDPDGWLTDGVHMTAAAHSQVADLILAAVATTKSEGIAAAQQAAADAEAALAAVGPAAQAAAAPAVAAAQRAATDAEVALQAQFMTQDEGVAALIGTNAGPETQVALDDRDRGPKPLTGVPVSIRDSATDQVFWMGKDRRTLYRGGGTIIKTSTNNGATWQQAGPFVFPTYTVGIRELDNGELLVATAASGGNPGALYLSSGGPGGTWTKVLTAGYNESGVKVGPSSFFNGEWGMSVHENIAVVSEYGIQNLGVDQARYVYLSQDYGQTWTRIYDIGDFQQAHVHAAFYDPWWKAIWVSQGDSTNRAVKYSLDMGATWTTIANPLNSQMVGGIALPGCILFSSDFQPDGIYRVERTPDRANLTLEFAYGIYNNQTDRRRYIGEMPYWTGRKGDPVLFPFISDVSWTGPGKLVVTHDGYTFKTVWTDTQSYQQAGLYKVLGPTRDGVYVGELDDNRQARMSTITFSYLPETPLDPNAFASSTYYKGRAGAGSYTQGDVLTLGSFAFVTRADVGTNVVAGGGSGNQENVIGGNLANVDTFTSNLTGAPTLTGENGNWNFLLGGYDTVVNGWANVVHGYHAKVGLDANHNTMSGGSRHEFTTGASYGTVGGGTQNKVSGVNATIGGGNTNQATGNGSTVGGGQTNTASAAGSLVSGGVANTASNGNATVAGGSTNTASGNSSTVLGGLQNTATATGSAVFAGRDNTASGLYSVASGRGAVASEAYMQAHGTAPFAAPGDAQINRWVLKQVTTTATAANLDADTGAPPVIPENTTWAFSALITARTVGVANESAGWEVRGCFKRDAGNTAALVGTPTVTLLGATSGASTWTVAVAAYSVGTLRLMVTGEASKTIRWVGELRSPQVRG